MSAPRDEPLGKVSPGAFLAQAKTISLVPPQPHVLPMTPHSLSSEGKRSRNETGTSNVSANRTKSRSSRRPESSSRTVISDGPSLGRRAVRSRLDDAFFFFPFERSIFVLPIKCCPFGSLCAEQRYVSACRKDEFSSRFSIASPPLVYPGRANGRHFCRQSDC